MLNVFNDMKHKRSVLPIGYRNAQKVNLIFNTYINLLITPLIHSITSISLFIVIIPTIMGYFDSHYNYSAISIIFWAFITSIALIHLYSLLCIGPCIFILIAVYLKYSFDAINSRIEFCAKHGFNERLMRAIVEHNAITRTTHTLNQFFSKIVFIVYFIDRKSVV